MSTIYIALGTNLGDRSANLYTAVEALSPRVIVTERSPVYETMPWGMTDQPKFLNMVIKGRTEQTPLRLLNTLKRLETRLGRVPAVRNGPRLIDLDILFYDDLVRASPRLTIPHPRLHERAFVLIPLADLAPDLVHPRLGRTVREMLADLDQTGVVPYG